MRTTQISTVELQRGTKSLWADCLLSRQYITTWRLGWNRGNFS